MGKNKDKQQSWWQTLPGVMTALGAIITATTGLLVALNQAGLIGVQAEPTPQSRGKPAISAATEAPNPPATSTLAAASDPTKTPAPLVAGIATSTAAPTAVVVVAPPEPTSTTAYTGNTVPAGSTPQYPIYLAAGGEATAGDSVFKIMAAQIERPSDDRLVLNITLRVINNGSSNDNFWDRSARLIVDDVPLAPFEAPNEIVDAHAAQQAPFLFEIPDNVTSVMLQVGQVGQETARIPLDLTAAQPPPTATPPASDTLQYPVKLAAGGEATAGDSVYRIVAAQIERPNDEQLVLSITLRVINNGTSNDNFWDRSARLVIEDIPYAPFKAPNEIVDAQDSRQAEFRFEIPGNVTSVMLQIGQVGQETARIPLDLAPVQ
ncbi:MAG TPA: hypothetical protein VFR15_00755 [Chloroflexia bacterium]|nr:hypothetical protein [Chloroflexia bacterium]